MLKVDELKVAVQQLSEPDLLDFQIWYRAFEAAHWDAESKDMIRHPHEALRDEGALGDESERETVPLASEEKWEGILAQPEAKSLMRQMAREALAEYRAGRTTEIVVTEDGRLAPAGNRERL